MTDLKRTITTLHAVSFLLNKFVQEGDLCFVGKLQLATLCDELRDTNAIIDNAEQEAKADIRQLTNDTMFRCPLSDAASMASRSLHVIGVYA